MDQVNPQGNPMVRKLEQSGLLQEQDRAHLRALCQTPREVAAETILVHEGDRANGIRIMMSGFAYRYKIITEGRRQIIGLLVPGDFCDLQAAILQKADHFIAMLTPGSIAYVPQSKVDDLTFAPSSLARALWWSTLLDESILRERLASIGQRRSDERLAHFFCELLIRLQIVGQADPNGCHVPFTQEHIADFVGLTRVHVSRTVKELRLKNLLNFKNRRLTILDRRRLEAFCGFDPTYLHLMGEEVAAMQA